MSDWLERELANEMSPEAAPGMLKIRLGLASPKPWEFHREALAVGFAVVMIIGGGYAASRTASLDVRQLAVRELSRPASRTPGAGAKLMRCDNGTGIALQANAAGKATILLAHSGSTWEGPHAMTVAPEAGCHHCHSL